MDTVAIAFAGIALVGVTPVTIGVIGEIIRNRAERRRQAMLDRHSRRIGGW